MRDSTRRIVGESLSCVAPYISGGVVSCLLSLLIGVGTPCVAGDQLPAPAPSELVQQLVHAARVYDESAITLVCGQFCNLQSRAIPWLSELIEHEDGVVRWKAVETIQQIGPCTHPGKQQLFARLVIASTDADPDVRAATVTCLVSQFPNEVKVCSIVDSTTRDANSAVQANAWWCRWQLNSDPAAIDALVQLLRSKDWMAHELAQRHLIEIGEPSAPALMGIISRVNDKGTLVRATVTLGNASSSQQSGKLLEALLEHPETAVVRAAARGLVARGKSSLTALSKLFRSDDARQQMIGLQCCAQLGREAGPVANDVRSLLRSKSRSTQTAAIAAYPAIAKADPASLLLYQTLLQNPDPDVRAAAVVSLKLWGAGAISLTDNVESIAINDTQDFIRQAAQETLDTIRMSMTTRHVNPPPES